MNVSIESFLLKVHLVLYHPLCLAIGRKSAPALPLEHDLVLYHPLLLPRDQQDQPQQRLRWRALVLYHLRSRRPNRPLLSQPPLLHVGISPVKVTRILRTPALLGQTLASLAAFGSPTGLLPLSNSRIRHKKPATELTPLPQR